ncbi:amino acid deaminase/aldolase [Saccharomonospora xinjiangensis]|uniref:amino acid deaminase/aldolase n=1 Tax=Saccharomonospora xinjiangensis TaxID=75294 RepID=UPI0010C3D381|nr:amino acid deaminase/aldolase [Saccharomonospora xinjiangensis]QBQ58452.1 D-threonine aldolase [Saccharomonospora xinjiangensis]
MSATQYDRATRDLDPPLAVVDLDAFDANADDLARRAGGLPIRIASKSVRCRALLSRVLARPGFSGLLCYTLAEALWLFGEGTSDDIVVGYPTVDRAALRALAADESARRAITVMVDSPAQLDLIDAALGPGHPELRVCLEFDASWRPLPGLHIGTRRSPVFSPAQAAWLARHITDRPGFRLVGVMGYEGQISGLQDDDTGLRGAAVRLIQRHSAAELIRRRPAVVDAVRAVAELEFVNGGGTGSLEFTRTDGSVTEVAAGSGLLGPTLFSRFRHFSPRPAALFALSVVRKPSRRIVTLAAGGYAASGQAEASRLPSPYLPPGLRLLTLEGAGEVQTPVTGRAARRLVPGDRVWFRHAKAGELAEHFPRYHLVSGDRIVRTVPTYRGEGHFFG